MAERERAVRLDEPQVGAGDVAPRALERRLGDLHADRVGAGLAQRGDEAPGAAAEVEHPLARAGPRRAAARAACAHSHGSGSSGASAHTLS